MERREIPPYKTALRGVNLVVFGANAAGAVLSAFYLSFIAPAPVGQAVVGAFSWLDWASTILGTIGLLVLGGWMNRYAERFFPQWYERLRQGVSCDSVPEAARREVLNYPFMVSLVSLCMWLLAGLIFGWLFGDSLHTALVIALVGGVFTTALVFFAVDFLWRPVVAVFFPNGNTHEVRALRLPVFARLLIVFLLTSLYPAGMLVMLSLDRARSIVGASNPEVILLNLALADVFLLIVVGDAALHMRAALADFNRKQKETNGPQLQCGIAVATGKVVAGNVGGKARLEYTVIGDTVNLAARLQAMSKELHHDILLNSGAFSLASRDLQLTADEIPNLSVRGKSEPVTIYVL